MNVTDINENKKNIRLQMKQGIIIYYASFHTFVTSNISVSDIPLNIV